MSVIWTPHRCEPESKSERGTLPVGSLWACECGTVWSYLGRVPAGTNGITQDGWKLIGDQYDKDGRSEDEAIRSAALERGRYP